jgi:hypothetical protein
MIHFAQQSKRTLGLYLLPAINRLAIMGLNLWPAGVSFAFDNDANTALAQLFRAGVQWVFINVRRGRAPEREVRQPS